jgi:hypothetical protein
VQSYAVTHAATIGRQNIIHAVGVFGKFSVGQNPVFWERWSPGIADYSERQTYEE